MNITEFRNGLKLIASLDRDEITKAIGRRLALSEWTYWLAKPNRAFLELTDKEQGELFDYMRKDRGL